MTPVEIAQILAKAAAFDQRTVGQADILAWHDAIGDINPGDALDAVSQHYRESTDRLMPAHVRRIADQLDRARRRAEREHREQLAIADQDANRGPVEDRSAQVDDLLTRLRNRLGASDPTVLRRTEWVKAERRRQRVNDAAGPNPHYTGPPPPGGWPIPGETA